MSNGIQYKRIILLFGIILFLLRTTVISGQKVTSTIPYELLGGKMIVKIIVNNNEERVIFDTGAGKSSFTKEFCNANSFILIDSIKVTDVNNNLSYYRRVKVDSLITPDRVIKFRNFYPIIIEDDSPVKCFDVVGLIGSDLIQNLICVIDSKTKTITLTTAEIPSKESLRYSHNFQDRSILPVFEMLINGASVNALFDSGYGGFLKLKNSDYDTLRSISAINRLDIGYGAKSIGLSGVSSGSVTILSQIENLRIGLAKFNNVKAETSNSPVTLLGAASLNYGKVVIDYPRRRFYYIPFSTEPVCPPYTTRKFNLTVSDGKLTIGTVWGEMADLISEGDEITHINGKPTGIYDFCTSIIKGIDDLKGEGTKLVKVRRKDGKVLELEYK